MVEFVDKLAEKVAPKSAATAWTVPATVLRVVDADTLYVTLDLGWHIQLTDYVRLLGINAPEAKTVEGEAATEFVRELVKPGDRVTVVSKKLLGQTEVHGRVLANVILANGDNLSDKVLEAGHAVAYK